MKTKLLRKLRKKAKKAIVLVQTGKYNYEIRSLSSGSFYTLSYIGGAFDVDYFKMELGRYRRDHIISEVKRIRNSKYPKTIDI